MGPIALDEWQQNARIVMVEADPSLQAELRDLLEGAGYRNIAIFAETFRTIDAIQRSPPDLLILGLHPPLLHGYAVLEEVKKLGVLDSYLPVLVISIKNDGMNRLRALSLGADNWLAEPYTAPEALARINNLLQIRRAIVRMDDRIEKLRLEVEDGARRMEQAHIELLERLARAGEFRDDDTGGHTRRVGELCEQIAGNIGYSREQAEIIGQAATLHDLGKIAVPDGILHKSGPLSTEEREQMKTHAAVGASVLRGGRSDIVLIAEQIAQCHHENWDGSGYPNGLKGDAIPLVARITSVADVFDAMTSDRPYRPGFSVEEVVDHIRVGAGSRFDPVVVNGFLKAVLGDDFLPVPGHYESPQQEFSNGSEKSTTPAE